MLTETEVLERAFRALDEIVGQHEVKAALDLEPRPPCITAEGEPHLMEVAAAAPKESEIAPLSLKGQAVELWCDHAGGRVFIVADDEDARRVAERYVASPGEIWTAAEVELVARLEDRGMAQELAEFKRRFRCAIKSSSL